MHNLSLRKHACICLPTSLQLHHLPLRVCGKSFDSQRCQPACQPASPQGRGSLLGAPPKRSLVSRLSKPFIHPPTATVASPSIIQHPNPHLSPITTSNTNQPALPHHRRRRRTTRDSACQAYQLPFALCQPKGCCSPCTAHPYLTALHPSPLCSFTPRRPRSSQGLLTTEAPDDCRRYAWPSSTRRWRGDSATYAILVLHHVQPSQYARNGGRA